jgi:glycosyltransferase involved in cell wall biosynthesis
MKENKNNIFIIGKIPPPYFGPAIATKIILESSLSQQFNLIHIDSRVNTTMKTMGKFRLGKLFIILKIYFKFLQKCLKHQHGIVLIPIAQETSGLLKDFLFYFIAILFGQKIIIHLRGSAILNWYQSTSHPMKVIYRSVIRHSDAAIVLGDKLRYLFEGFIDDEKLFVVPNGANYTFPVIEKKGKIKLLFIANFHQNKGLLDLLKAIDMLGNDILDLIEVNLCGNWKSDEKFKQDCMSIIRKHSDIIKVKENIWGNDKYLMLASSDIFVFPPNKPEGHPWVIVEALAAGLPIISTDMGAITESVINNFNGFIINPNNHTELAEKMKTLVSDEKQRKQMSKNSQSIYFNKYTEDKMVENLGTVFNQVLSR